MLLTSTVIEELSEVCMRLAVHAAVWREIRELEREGEHREAILAFELLFDSTADAHFQAVVMHISMLGESRSDVISLRNAIDGLDESNSDLASSLRRSIAEREGTFANIERIRSKVYAHRDRDLGPEMVFSAAPISLNSVGACVDVLIRAMSEISAAALQLNHPGALYDDIDARARCAVDQLHQVLSALDTR